ncbi:MAG: transglycosylase SLT domain-containing protein [Rikenellaceae bacterium]
MKLKGLLIFIFISIFTTTTSFSQTTTVEDGDGTFKINATAQQYDSLLSDWYEKNINMSYDNFLNEFVDIDMSEEYAPKEALPDSVYQNRLNMLASAIQLPYNPIVKQYIMRYTIKYHTFMNRMIGLAQYYMPIFEKELDINGLPEELKIMPVIESALNPSIKSRAGAAGLWQFMLPVGKYYGLEYNSFVDERFDPVKSTQAACQLIKDYYKIYGDWTLVIAAYNCGSGNVNKAIKRVPNAKTYWDIYEYLPRETRGHIPSFIAMTYAYTFHKAHGFEPTTPPHPVTTDTVHINRMLHFDQITSTLNLPIELIRDLNPQYKKDIIPAKEKQYTLVLPMDEISRFVEFEQDIFGKDTIYLAEYLNIDTKALEKTDVAKSATTTSSSSASTYKVKKGDNLGSIAARYKVKANDLMRLNNITDPRKLRIGQVLKLK